MDPADGVELLSACSGRYPPIPAHYSDDLKHLIDALIRLNPDDRPDLTVREPLCVCVLNSELRCGICTSQQGLASPLPMAMVDAILSMASQPGGLDSWLLKIRMLACCLTFGNQQQ